jgi:putative peptidoglycan lipid II flippase
VTDQATGSSALTKSVAGMGAAAAVSRAFGALRMVVIAAVLGTTYLGNTFQSSNSVSNVLFELLAAGALSAVLVPTFVDHFSRGDVRRAEELAGGVLSLALAALTVVSLIGVVCAPFFARVLTSGVADPAVAAQQRALATFLLRFFVPQVMLYAVGAVTTAVLHARRSFALTAIAPIGNTVVLVAAMILFRAMAGSSPGLDLSSGERLCLALGGTIGVAAFVGVPAVGLRMSGFRLRMGLRRPFHDDGVRRLLRLSGWTALQHSGTGILLAGALIASGGIAGGVVAYQLAMVVFLSPYGILAQPIHTAVLPQLAAHVASGDREAMRSDLRWSADAMAAVTVPVAALLVGLSLPVMHVLAFGEAAHGDGPQLLAASLAGLALGIPLYGGFFLLTRAAYALGDSRTPAIASITSAALGAAAMLVVGHVVDGPARLFAIGAAHSASYLLGMVWLGWRLHPMVGGLVSRAQVTAMVPAGAVAVAAWLALRGIAPRGHITTFLLLAMVTAAAVGAYGLALRALGVLPDRAPPVRPVLGTV